MISLQETFDTVIAHLRKQGCAARYQGSCKYREPYSEKKCAAGCLIPDDKYDPHYEGMSVKGGDGATTPVGKLIASLGHDIDFVYELQTVHDHTGPKFWEREFKRIADHRGLIYAPPECIETNEVPAGQA